MPQPRKPASVFFSYAPKDQRLRDRLETQLSLLKQQGLISSWHDRKIGAGKDWSQEINSHFEAAQIILLLISPDFIASDYCYGIEMRKAMEKHETGQSLVIPIILRPVIWEDTPFQKLQVLPANKKPVTIWRNIDEAFLDIANGIREAIKMLKVNSEECHIPEERNKFLEKNKVDILVVEDDSRIGRLIGIMLVCMEYNFFYARDGLEAIKYVSEREFDLILLDLYLPNMDGVKIIRRLRKQKISTPIIIISAANNKKIVQGIKIGADGFVQKPFTSGMLFTVIEGILGNKTTVFTDGDAPRIYENEI